MRVNIKTIADKADVSIATVSRVLRNDSNVTEKTKEKVLKIVKQYDYEINAIARSLRQEQSNTVGIIISDILSQFCSIIAKSSENTLSKHGYITVLCNTDENPEKELNYLKIMKSNRAAGILLMPTGKNKNYINNLLKSGMKIVLIDRLIDDINCDAILFENEIAAYNATKHLINQGYKKIAIIVGTLEIKTENDRLKGYLRALKEVGIPKNDTFIKIASDVEKTDFSKEELGSIITEELLNIKNRPDAIFTSTLSITLGALKTIKKFGLKIPNDIGVVVFDDSIWSLLIDPPITAVSIPTADLSNIAVELLMKRIKNKNTNLKKPETIVLETSLIVRESTKKIKKT